VFQIKYLEVYLFVLVLSGLVHGVDLEGDGRNVFSGVRFSGYIEFIFLSQIRKKSEKLLEGVVQVGGHVHLVLGVALVLPRETET